MAKTNKTMMPVPVGYHMLIALPPQGEKIGNVFIPDDLKAREHTASIVGNVLAMGPDCYLDTVKFPTGPWCKVGDWILMKSYTGARFKIKEQEFRIINDDSILSVVADPRFIERA
jgi:co-chaperonin GroES (HSP10)